MNTHISLGRLLLFQVTDTLRMPTPPIPTRNKTRSYIICCPASSDGATLDLPAIGKDAAKLAIENPLSLLKIPILALPGVPGVILPLDALPANECNTGIKERRIPNEESTTRRAATAPSEGASGVSAVI
jgi:hypothetical protein